MMIKNCENICENNQVYMENNKYIHKRAISRFEPSAIEWEITIDLVVGYNGL
jgi:hypothetical protein